MSPLVVCITAFRPRGPATAAAGAARLSSSREGFSLKTSRSPDFSLRAKGIEYIVVRQIDVDMREWTYSGSVRVNM